MEWDQDLRGVQKTDVWYDRPALLMWTESVPLQPINTVWFWYGSLIVLIIICTLWTCREKHTYTNIQKSFEQCWEIKVFMIGNILLCLLPLYWVCPPRRFQNSSASWLSVFTPSSRWTTPVAWQPRSRWVTITETNSDAWNKPLVNIQELKPIHKKDCNNTTKCLEMQDLNYM